jgi:hypothetical protein
MYGESGLLEAEGMDLFEEGDFEEGSELDFELEAGVLPEPQMVGQLEEVDEYAYEDGFEAGGDYEEFFESAGEPDELEWESELWESGEPDPEAEFFKKLRGFVKKAARGAANIAKKAAPALARVAAPMFKKLAPIAARVVGGAIGGPAGAAIAGTVANTVLREAESETESDATITLSEGDVEFEQEGGNASAYELMEVYAAEAAATPDPATANAALTRMATNSVRLFQDNPRLKPVLPHVVKSALALALTLRRNPQTRWAVRTVPLIVKRALTRLARAPQITQKAVVEAMAHETSWVLANRERAIAALRRHRIALRRAPLHVRPRAGMQPMPAAGARPVPPARGATIRRPARPPRVRR